MRFVSWSTNYIFYPQVVILSILTLSGEFHQLSGGNILVNGAVRGNDWKDLLLTRSEKDSLEKVI